MEEQVGVIRNQYYLTTDNYLDTNYIQYYKGNLDPNYIPIFSYVGEYDPWANNQLNTEILNTNFINYLNFIDTDLTENIATTQWKVGGFGDNPTEEIIIKNIYNDEILNNTEIYRAKIGLMYVSDYGYAEIPDHWTTELDLIGYTVESENWLYLGLYDLTISMVDYDANAWYVNYRGAITRCYYMEDCLAAVRPCFYLNSDVEYASGSGTESDPIRLKID